MAALRHPAVGFDKAVGGSFRAMAGKGRRLSAKTVKLTNLFPPRPSCTAPRCR